MRAKDAQSQGAMSSSSKWKPRCSGRSEFLAVQLPPARMMESRRQLGHAAQNCGGPSAHLLRTALLMAEEPSRARTTNFIKRRVVHSRSRTTQKGMHRTKKVDLGDEGTERSSTWTADTGRGDRGDVMHIPRVNAQYHIGDRKEGHDMG